MDQDSKAGLDGAEEVERSVLGVPRVSLGLSAIAVSFSEVEQLADLLRIPMGEHPGQRGNERADMASLLEGRVSARRQAEDVLADGTRVGRPEVDQGPPPEFQKPRVYELRHEWLDRALALAPRRVTAWFDSWKEVACEVQVAALPVEAFTEPGRLEPVASSPAYGFTFVRTPDGRLWRVHREEDR